MVQTTGAVTWLTPTYYGPTTAAIDEGIYSEPATSGGTYFWDGQQYHYNWSTKGFKTGSYWRIGVMLDDGQKYYVYIGLR